MIISFRREWKCRTAPQYNDYSNALQFPEIVLALHILKKCFELQKGILGKLPIIGLEATEFPVNRSRN